MTCRMCVDLWEGSPAADCRCTELQSEADNALSRVFCGKHMVQCDYCL